MDILHVEEGPLSEAEMNRRRERTAINNRNSRDKRTQLEAEGGCRRPPTTYDEATRRIQADIEAFGTEADKVKRRALLRGFRAALWAAQSKPTPAELYALLREEAFGV